MLNKDVILLELAEFLNSNKINWALGASFMMKLRSIEVDVNDIDLMIHERDFDHACQLISKHGIEKPISYSSVFQTERYKKFEYKDLSIDCMAGMTIHTDSRIIKYHFDQAESYVILGNANIPLCYLEDWYVLYRCMPNRQSKVEMIETYFINHRANKERIKKLLFIDLNDDDKQALMNLIR